MSSEPGEINIVKLFEKQGFTIRTAIENGETLYCAKDICKSICLGESTHRKKLRALDPDEVRGCLIETPLGGTQTLSFVTEPGLYKMLLWSRGAKTPGHPAHRFTRWVTHDVLPQIRKNGIYKLEKRLKQMEQKHKHVLVEKETRIKFLKENRLYHIAWDFLECNSRNFNRVKELMKPDHRKIMLDWEDGRTPYVMPQYVRAVRNLIQTLKYE